MQAQDRSDRFRWLRRLVVVIVAVPMVLLMLLDAILSDAVLQGTLDRFLAPNVEGSVDIGHIKVSALRNFPNLRVEIRDFTILSDKFDGALAMEEEGMGGDTLAHADMFVAAINVMDALRGEINIPQLKLSGLRAYAHKYDSLSSNWNIFRFEGEDSGKDSQLPEIQFGKILIDETAKAVYTDRDRGIYAGLDLVEMSAYGRFDANLLDKLYLLGGRPAKDRFRIELDSLSLFARIPSSGEGTPIQNLGDEMELGLDLEHLALFEHNDHLDMELEAGVAAELPGYPKLTAPVTLDTEIGFPPVPEGALGAFNILAFDARAAALPLKAEGGTVLYPDRIDMDLTAMVDNCSVGEIFKEYAQLVFPFFKYIRTDACISLEASSRGSLNMEEGIWPEIEALLKVPDSHFSYSSVIEDSEFDMTLRAFMDREGVVSAELEDFCFDMDGLSLNVKGYSENLVTDNPVIEVDGSAQLSLASLVSYLPPESGLVADGNLDVELKGSIKPMQFSLYQLCNSGLNARMSGDLLKVEIPADTLSAQIWNPLLTLEDNHYSAAVDTMSFVFGEGLRGQVSKLRARAVNSADTLSNGLPKMELLLDASAVDVQSGEELELMLRGSRNRFSVSQNSAGAAVMRARTEDNAIILNMGDNRVLLRSSAMDVSTRQSAGRTQGEDRGSGRSGGRGPSGRQRGFAPDSVNLVRPDFLSDADFKLKDINLKLDSSLLDLYRKYSPSGKARVGTAKFVTPVLPLRLAMDSLDLNFDSNSLALNSVSLSAGSSSLSAHGTLDGLRGAFMGRGVMNLDMDVRSQRLNANELIAAFRAGAADTLGQREQISDNRDYQNSIVTDSLENAIPDDIGYPLIVVPANLNARMKLDVADAKVSQFEIKGLSTELNMKERTIQLLNTMVLTDVGNASLDAFYSTITKENISAGFNLGLREVTADKVIELFPAVDSLVPMLKSFKGKLNLDLAATSQLDTNMNLVLPSMDGIVRLEGSDLLLEDTGSLRRIAKLLMFKDTRSGHIDDMALYGIISDNKLEVYPFLLGVDRYTLALSGLQQFDTHFDYHLSLLESPLPFHFGLELLGNFDKWNYSIGRPKYRSKKLPQILPYIEEIQNKLSASIRDIFAVGVEDAMADNRRARREAQRQGDSLKDEEEDTLFDPEEFAQLDSLMLEYEVEQELMDIDAEIEALLGDLDYVLD